MVYHNIINVDVWFIAELLHGMDDQQDTALEKFL